MPPDPSGCKRRKTEVSRYHLPGLHREKKLSDINLTDQEGNTRLHIAARDGHVREVERLIQCGARVDARNNNSETPFELADNAGHTVVAAILFYNAEINRGAAENNQKMPR